MRLALGYDRISFADDVFTMKKERVIQVCRGDPGREVCIFSWECLGRVDALDYPTALEMKAGRLHPDLLWDRIWQRPDPRTDEQKDHARTGAPGCGGCPPGRA